MSAKVSVFLPLAGDRASIQERFAGDPGGWLSGSRPCGPSAWCVTVHYRGLHRDVELHLGSVWQVGDTAWRTLTWRPLPDERDVGAVDRLLPSLTAELGLHTGHGGVSLVLAGSYDPPGALLGDLADAVMLHRVAERTAVGFLEDVAAGLVSTAHAPV